MKRILLRAGKAPHEVTGPEAAFAYAGKATYAMNAGNLVYTEAVYRLLSTPDVEVVPDSLSTERPGVTKAHIDRINEEFDAYVLPLANALRIGFAPNRARLTEVIRQLKIPVVIVGIGAQLSPKVDWHWIDDDAKANQRAFISAVLDHSASIGVRGEATRSYLLHLGFHDSQIDVIGCPSMHDAGPDAVIRRKVDALRPDSPIAVNADHRIPGTHKVVTDNLERYSDLVFVSQNQAEAALLLWGKPIADYPDGLPGTMDHPLYRDDRMRFFPDPRPWREFMATRDFCLGSRMHGSIAALMAGTPAMVIAHDSRLMELCRYHQIPHRMINDVIDEPWDAARFHDLADPEPINSVRAENFHRYIGFIERNGLEHIHQPGKANPDYDAVLAAAPHPGGIRPLTADPGQVASRLRWLWQDAEGDRARTVGTYRPPFAPRPTDAGLEERVKRLEARVAKQEKALKAQASTWPRRALHKVRRTFGG